MQSSGKIFRKIRKITVANVLKLNEGRRRKVVVVGLPSRPGKKEVMASMIKTEAG